MNWSQERVAKVADVMRMEYMSSEESEIDEESQKVRHYNVRKLSWESRELRRSKRKLDKCHSESLPGLSKRIVVPRQEGDASARSKPPTCPDWACVAQNNEGNIVEDLNVSR
jgi:hypothetical protein